MKKLFGISLSHRNGGRKISKSAALGLAAAGILVIAAGAAALSAPQGTIVPDHKVLSIVASLVKADPGANNSFIVEFSARIQLRGNGQVKYRWRRSDGGMGAWREINFSSAGFQSVTTTWTIGAAHSGQEIWESLEVNYPNAITSNQAKFQVPPLNFKVTGVVSKVVPYEWTGICPKKFDVTSQITAAGSGVVKYRWVRSDGGSGAQLDLPFTASGTQTVQSSWTVSNHEYDQGVRRWMTVEVLSPNHILPAPDDAPSTGFRPYAPAFILTCKDFAQNPNAPVQMSVSISGFDVQPSYNCNTPSYRTPTNMMGGSITLKNLSSNPLIIRKNMGSYWQTYVWLTIMYPAKKEFVNQTPPWPYIYNTNWYTRDIDLPEQIAPHSQYEAQFGACLENFDKHAVLFVGARHENTETGQKTFSNLVKWEKKF